jgi:hypothetical protein
VTLRLTDEYYFQHAFVMSPISLCVHCLVNMGPTPSGVCSKEYDGIVIAIAALWNNPHEYNGISDIRFGSHEANDTLRCCRPLFVSVYCLEFWHYMKFAIIGVLEATNCEKAVPQASYVFETSDA